MTKQPNGILLLSRNIQWSASAVLETWLVSDQCVRTTAMAADCMANIQMEVSQHGWMHSLAVVVREWIHLHQTATLVGQLTHRERRTQRYRFGDTSIIAASTGSHCRANAGPFFAKEP
jgi:hypothetical protein